MTGPLDPAGDPDRFDPARGGVPAQVGPLDPAGDPDRFDPQRDRAGSPPGRLDPGGDPDRFDATLPALLGAGAHEDERDNWAWLLGLVCVVGFLGLVTLLMSVASPR